MKSTTMMLGVAFAASTALSSGALAQREGYGTSAPRTQPQPRGGEQQAQKPARAGGATVTIGDRKVKISAEFAKAYQDLVAAIEANDTASFKAKAAAAHAAAKTPEEHYMASQAQYNAGIAAKQNDEIATALDAMTASGFMAQDQLSKAYLNLGKARYNLKQYPAATAALEKVLQLEPNNSEAVTLLAHTRSAGGNPSEGVAALQKTIAQQSANGAKAPEDLYKRAIQIAYKAKLPNTPELSRQWVSAYPTPTNWRDAIGIYRNLNNVDDAGTLDLLRLARTAKALKGEADYDRYAYAALSKGYPGEAKAVLEEGVAAGVVDLKKSPFKEMIEQANAKSAGEEASLDSAAAKGLSAGTAKAALTTGDLLYGYGRYDKAAELYRAALKKPGADASLINLHLGMALARAGDKAGAAAALNAVTGPRADIAKYWLALVETQG